MKKFFRFIFIVVLIFIGVSYFMRSNESKADNITQTTPVETQGQNYLDKVGDKVSEGIDAAKEAAEKAISNHETSIIIGELVVKGKGKDMICYVKTGFFEKYRVKTITGTDDSYIKLAGYNGKKIKISGIMNMETKEITAITYKLSAE